MKYFLFLVLIIGLSSCQEEFVMPEYRFEFSIQYTQAQSNSATMQMDYVFGLNKDEIQGSLNASDSTDSISHVYLLNDGDIIYMHANTPLDSTATVKIIYKAIMGEEVITSGTLEDTQEIDFSFVN